MKRILCLLLMLTCLCIPAFAEEAAENEIVVPFEILENPNGAISARIGMSFDSEVFEFVSAQVLSRDVLSSAPTSPERQFGLLSMRGISAGVIGTITLRLRENAPDGDYEILPVVDSVYNLLRRPVELMVIGGVIRVENQQMTLLEREIPVEDAAVISTGT